MIKSRGEYALSEEEIALDQKLQYIAIVEPIQKSILYMNESGRKALGLSLEEVQGIYGNDLFGEKPYSRTLGLIVSVNTAGYAVGAYLADLCRKLTKGSYTPILFIGSAVLAVVFVLLQFVISAANREKRKVAQQEEAERLAMEKAQ